MPPLFANALSLDGVDAYASIPDSPSLDLGTGATDDFTIETFFYVPDLTTAATNTLIWKQGAYSLFVIFSNTAPDRLIFKLWTGPATYAEIYHSVDLSVGWHHVAAVFDNDYTANQDLMALYLDGSLVGSSTAFGWTPGIPNSSSALNVGAYVGVNPFVGWIEKMRFSDIVRYSGTSYTVPSAPIVNDADTRALWHFNEPAGSTVFADDSGNGNSLTGLNGAQTGSAPRPAPGDLDIGFGTGGKVLTNVGILDREISRLYPLFHAPCPRLDYPGAIHHVICRGIERGRIFRSDQDRRRFLDRLAERSRQRRSGAQACDPTFWMVGPQSVMSPFATMVCP
jgi:hypothetical protein